MFDVCGQTLRLPALVRNSCRSPRRIHDFVLTVFLSVRSSVNVRLRWSRPVAASNLDHARLHLSTSNCVNSLLNSRYQLELYLQDNLPTANPHRPGIPWSVDIGGTNVVDTIHRLAASTYLRSLGGVRLTCICGTENTKKKGNQNRIIKHPPTYFF